MLKNRLSLIVAVIISLLLLSYLLLSNGNAFNVLPYMIYRSIAPAGGNEKLFIIFFDIIVVALLCALLYKILKRK